MDEQMFWSMSNDGRLAAMAQEKPLEFDILCEEVVTQVIESGGVRSDFLQQYYDEITLKLLSDILIFDDLSVLVPETPEVFELKRKQFIKAHIRLLGNNKKIARLNQLQWTIDCERNKHSTTLGKCVALTRMMNESFWGENGLRDAVMGFVEVRKESRNEISIEPVCVVLLFKPLK